MDSKFLKHGYELSIVLDISSESIGGSIVVQNVARESSIIYSTRIPIIWEQPATQQPLLIKIKQTLMATMKQLHDHGLVAVSRAGIYTSKISKVFVTYASPWYLSQTKGLVVNYDKAIRITKPLLKALIAEEEKQFLKELKADTHSELYSNVHIIERRIVDIKLNGYGTSSPYNKKAQKIEISLHTSFVSRDILLITNDSINSYFNCRAISYFSFPLVAFTALADLTRESPDSIIIDIRGETTDLSLIKNSALWESLSFPLGTGGLLRGITEKTNASIHIAQSLLYIYYQRKPLPEVVLSLEPAFAQHTALWTAQYRDAVKDLTSSMSMIKNIRLIVDPRLEKYFTTVLRAISPDVVLDIVHGYDLREHIQGVTRYPDTPLALESYFASLLKK